MNNEGGFFQPLNMIILALTVFVLVLIVSFTYAYVKIHGATVEACEHAPPKEVVECVQEVNDS